MNLEDLGWGEPFASAFAALDLDGSAPARVIAVHRGHLVVAGTQGEALAVVAGRTRERATIGDWVVVDARGTVSARLPRHGVLARAGQVQEMPPARLVPAIARCTTRKSVHQ